MGPPCCASDGGSRPSWIAFDKTEDLLRPWALVGVLPVDRRVTTTDHLLLHVATTQEELSNGASIPVGRYPAEVDGASKDQRSQVVP